MTKQEIEARNKCDRFMCRAEKRDNINIVYGYYFQIRFGRVEVGKISEGINDVCIKQETLSQCTGVEDFKQTMIFENDIVRVERYGGSFGVVEWDKKAGEWYIFFFDDNRSVENYISLSSFEDNYIAINVIGDKFSNPELLKGE